MSIGKVGVPYKVVYASKNFVSGLNDIEIRVLKPDGTLHQSGTMTEFGITGFEGIYFFMVNSNSVDSEGEYTVSIVSPSEGHKAKTKFSLVESFGGGSGSDGELSDIELELEVGRPKVELNTSRATAELNASAITAELDSGKVGANLELLDASAELNVSIPEIELKIDCA